MTNGDEPPDMTNGDERTGSGGDPPPGGSDEDVAATAEELAAVLSDLREDIEAQRRGPLGLPAPPRPGDLLRFADDYAIPLAIAVLEANIRALELLQGAIRLVESGERAGTEARAARDRAASLSRATLDRLDRTLADLEAAATGGELPPNEEARSVVQEARELRSELATALEDGVGTGADDPAGSDGPGGADDAVRGNDPLGDDPPGADPAGDDPLGDDPPGDDAGSATGPETADGEDGSVPVDVEGELQSIKADLGKVDEEPADGESPADDAESSEGGSEPDDAAE